MSETAVGYARLSQNGRSIPEQIEAIEEYCKRKGLVLVNEGLYSDGVNSSGYSADREAYQNMLDRIEGDDVDHVVVRDRSRLSRDSKHRLRLFLDLDTRGVEIHVTEPDEIVDLEDPYSLTRESAQADADDVEKRKEAERGRAEAERRMEEGLPMGRAPIGLEYAPDRDGWVAGGDFDAALRVLELRDDGLSYRAIADRVDAISKDQVGTIVRRRDEYEAVRDAPESEKPGAER